MGKNSRILLRKWEKSLVLFVSDPEITHAEERC